MFLLISFDAWMNRKIPLCKQKQSEVFGCWVFDDPEDVCRIFEMSVSSMHRLHKDVLSQSVACTQRGYMHINIQNMTGLLIRYRSCKNSGWIFQIRPIFFFFLAFYNSAMWDVSIIVSFWEQSVIKESAWMKNWGLTAVLLNSAIGTSVSYSHCLILGKQGSHGFFCTDPHEKGFAPFFITEPFQNLSLLPTHIQNLLVVRGGLSCDSLLLHRHTHTKKGFEELFQFLQKLEKRSKSNRGKSVCFTLQWPEYAHSCTETGIRVECPFSLTMGTNQAEYCLFGAKPGIFACV